MRFQKKKSNVFMLACIEDKPGRGMLDLLETAKMF